MWQWDTHVSTKKRTCCAILTVLGVVYTFMALLHPGASK